jgi:hypothetical protein
MTKNEALIVLGLSGQVTKDQIKQAYRKASMTYHPDRNPAGAEMMKVINAAFEMVKDLEDVTVEENASMGTYPEELSEAINAIITIAELEIEVCGLWVWVSGQTKDHKEVLKTAGFKWASKKKQWYYRPANHKCRNRNGKTLEMGEIRAKYGSDNVETKTAKKIQAA